MRVLSIIGSRPEGIKMAPVMKALAAAPSIEFIVCTTGQHLEMLDQVLDIFGITPDYELKVMQPNQTLANLSAVIFERLKKISL